MKRLIYLVGFMGGLILSWASVSAWGAGKAPAQPPSPAPAAVPVRPVILKPVQTRVFTLPNGKQADMQKDLDAIFSSVVTESPVFMPYEPGPGSDLCDTHIELRPTVSTFEMDVSELNLRFGYSPAGVDNPFQRADGELDVTTGTIAMDFSVWECTHGSCHSVSASTADQSASTVKGKFRMNFGTIHGGADFVHYPVVQKVIREIMTAGMKTLNESTRLNELTWKARVRQVSEGSGTVLFDKGGTSRLSSNQQFVVYASSEATGVCEVFLPVARIHTTQVDPVSSFGVIDELLDTRGVNVGDVVMIRLLGK